MSGPTSSEPHTVLIAVGSNIEPEINLTRAVRRLAERFPGLVASCVYATAAVGAPDAPPFLNAAVAIATGLSLAELKHGVLRPIEAELGRVRGADRNAPRPIDLDVAFCPGLVLSDPDLVTCAHLALPLADLVRGEVHPLDGRTLAEIAARFEGASGVRVAFGPERLLGG